MALLCVLIAIVALYIGPARSYWTTRGEARDKAAEVAKLEREHARLKARQKALTTPSSLAAEARKLGYVMPGEKAYVIEDLPKG